MLWFRKKVDENDLETFKKRLRAAEASILELNIDMEALRDKVLRKIQSRKPKDDEENEEKSSTGIPKMTAFG
jgi:hypothetical protein